MRVFLRTSAFLLSHSFIASGDRPIVLLSTSRKTGCAPIYESALQVAIKVSACVITSSSFFTPERRSDMWRAFVPLTHTTARFAPVYFAISSSKRSTNLPTDETKVVLMHSLRYAFSFPAKTGTANGVNS